MGILDGIVEWIAEQVMAGLDLVTTSVLGALGCDMAVFLRYFPAAETMYSVFVALAIGIILLNWVWQLFKNFGLGAGVEAEDPVHRLAETYVTMDNAGVCVYRDEKPAIFAPEGYAGGRIVYPAFFSSREVKEMGIDTTKIRSSRSTGILLAPSGIFVTYNSSSALMKWRYKSEMRVKALIWSVICQQRLSPQFRHEDVHGLILGNSMDLAYQILTSTGGRKHDFFMLDGSYEHFLYLTNDHQGEVILALLCDPGKTAELDRILLQGLTARQPGLAIEHDGISPDGSPVLFGYFCDLPRIARFNTSLELSERPGTLICFDFQAEVLRSYCGSRVRFQTIDFTKFEGRLFP